MDEEKGCADVCTVDVDQGCRNCGQVCDGNYCSSGCAHEADYFDAADRAYDAWVDRGEP